MKIVSEPLATKFKYKKKSEDQGCRVKNDLDLILAVELRPPAALLLGEAAPGGVEAKQAKQRTQLKKNSVEKTLSHNLNQVTAPCSRIFSLTKREFSSLKTAFLDPLWIPFVSNSFYCMFLLRTQGEA
jgi:hypothetical protein